MTWDDLSAASLDEILGWASDQPWARAMADCQQDVGWHSEGDVWTHTKLVCAQLPQLDQWGLLTPQEQMVLIFTALFHDSAKPLTSHVDPESGRITSPKHAIKGEHLVRSVLREVGCPLTIREEVARMVRFHGRPAFLLERADPAHEVVSLSWLVINRLLFLFALTDTRGRNTSETGRPEENLHLWKMVAEENGCFDQPYPFANDQARFLFYRQTRQRWVDLFADYDARIEMVYVEPPMPAVLAQNRRREKPVPENVILQLASKCEPPTLTEAHGLVMDE